MKHIQLLFLRFYSMGYKGQTKKGKKAVLDAIEGSAGVYSIIAARLGVTRTSAATYVNKWDETKKKREEEIEKIKDKAESNVIVEINNGNVQESKWFLGLRARDRGYSEKVDVNVSGDLTTHLDTKDERLKKFNEMMGNEQSGNS